MVEILEKKDHRRGDTYLERLIKTVRNANSSGPLALLLTQIF